MQFISDSYGSGVRMPVSCKACRYVSYASIPNATQLGTHVLQCTNTAKRIKDRLLLENDHYVNHFRKMGSSATIYGVLETPNKLLQKRSYSAVQTSRSKLIKLEKSKVGDVSTDSLDSYERRSKICELLTSFIVNHMLPFSILRKEEGKDELCLLLELLYPFSAENIPSPTRMASKNLDAYYQQFVTLVKGSITASLQNSFGTLVFDGWKDK